MLAVAGAALLTGVLARRLLAGIDGVGDLLLVGLGGVIGWLAADLLTGVVHWWADRIGSEHFPVLGPAFVRPFREHHEDPRSICRHDFAETNGNTCLVAVPVLAFTVVWLGDPPQGALGILGLAAFVSLAFWSCLTNQIHKWAHLSSAPRLVARLQGAGLVLSPARHARHHRPPHTERYCITNGWLDLPLDRLRVFTRLERGLARLTTSRRDRRPESNAG